MNIIKLKQTSLEKVIHWMLPIVQYSGKGKIVERIKNIWGFFPFASE